MQTDKRHCNNLTLKQPSRQKILNRQLMKSLLPLCIYLRYLVAKLSHQIVICMGRLREKGSYRSRMTSIMSEKSKFPKS